MIDDNFKGKSTLAVLFLNDIKRTCRDRNININNICKKIKLERQNFYNSEKRLGTMSVFSIFKFYDSYGNEDININNLYENWKARSDKGFPTISFIKGFNSFRSGETLTNKNR